MFNRIPFLMAAAATALAASSSLAQVQTLPQPQNAPTQYIPSVPAPSGSYSSQTYTTTPSAPAQPYAAPQYSAQPVTPPQGYQPMPSSATTPPATAAQAPVYQDNMYENMAPSAAPAAVPTPQTQTQSQTMTGYSSPIATPPNQMYISGGVGSREQEYFKSVEKDYNLKLLFAGTEGEFLANVNVTISDNKGNVIFTTATQGPVLLVKLDPGTYKIHAEKDGQTFDQSIKTGKGLTSKNIHMKIVG